MVEDRKVIGCNYKESRSECSIGARCYVCDRVGNRILILARSRSGRWIYKWENVKKLTNFRLKTLPPEHPLYGDLRIECFNTDWLVVKLQEAM